MDRLARDGVRFASAYCNAPLCTPGRYAFVTGRHGSKTGGYDNASYMPSTMPTFAHYLRSHFGYRTAVTGKMHFVGPDQLHGFEERYTTDVYPSDYGWVPDWTRPDERVDLWYHNAGAVVQSGIAAISNQLEYDDEVGAAALRAIYDHARRGEDARPLCLLASFIHPHDPYAARRKYWDLYEDREIPMPTTPRPKPADNDPHSLRLEKAMALDAVDISDADILRARRAYLANASYVDEWLGRLRDALDETGLAEDTSILLIADHGDMLGERGLWYKMSFYEWSVRVPCVLYVPGREDLRGRVVPTEVPVSQVDVLPTLLRLATDAAAAGATPKEDSSVVVELVDAIDGEDLLAIAESGTRVVDSVVAAEYLAEAAPGQPMLMLREGRYKYTTCPGDPDQLFDLVADPNEVDDLAKKKTSSEETTASVLERFRARAKQHWDVDAVRTAVLESQRRRRLLTKALQTGKRQSWDWQPRRDASEEYTRSHHDLTVNDALLRWPRPPPFEPRWR